MKIEFINYALLSETMHEKLLKLRNAPFIKEKMHTKEDISLNEHLQFVDMLNVQKDKVYFALFCDEKLIGGVSATQITQKSCEWGVFFDERTSFMIKSFAVYNFLNYLFGVYKLHTIYAKVKQNNENAVAFNKSFGFLKEKDVTIKDVNYSVLYLNKEHFMQNRHIETLRKRMKKIKIEFKE